MFSHTDLSIRVAKMFTKKVDTQAYFDEAMTQVNFFFYQRQCLSMFTAHSWCWADVLELNFFIFLWQGEDRPEPSEIAQGREGERERESD